MEEQDLAPVAEKSAAPIPRPSGSFVTARAGAQTPAPLPTISERQPTTEAEVQAGEDVGASDEDAQPSFSHEEVRYPRQSTDTSYEDEMNDEDRLAYLRAQAAQERRLRV